MSTPEFEVHRAIVHYSNPTTGEAHVRIPSLLGAGQTVTIPTTGLTNSDGFWNVPSIGSSTFIAVSADRTQFLWLTAIGVAGSGGDDPSNEPIGHEDRTASYIAFDNGTRTFSIQPANGSYVVWCVGLRYEKATLESIQIPDVTGLYYISFDAQGQLQYSTDYFVWDQDCPTAYVYWNSTTQRAEFFADERHGITMDWQTHEYLHRTRGAAYANGFDASNFDTSTQNGNTDAQAKLDIDNGTFFDEDLQVDVRHSLAPAQNTWEQQLQGPARIPVFYKIGTGWKYDAPTDFPVKQGTTHPVYNRTSDWSVQELGANSYGVQWIVATNQLNYPILSIMGQEQYNNVGQAESASWADMDLDGLPIVEIRVLYKIIFRATGSNTPGCYFEQIDDYRNALSNATSTAAAVVDHGNLTGLADNDHPQYAVAGSDGQIQYNNGGSFAGSSSLTFDDTSGKVTTNILQLATGPDVNGAGGGSLRLGNYGSQASMALDANEIQAFNASGNPATLNLNIVGSNVAFGSSSSPGSHTANGDLTATGNVTVGGGLTAATGQFGGSSGDAITIGNDSKLVDVNIANHLGVYGLQDSTVASIKLGSAGGTLSGSSSRIGINDTSPSYTLDVAGDGRFTTDLSVNGTMTATTATATTMNATSVLNTNYIRNTNGNFLALEGGDSWNLGTNASGEYVWMAAEGGIVIVSSDANSTAWANRNQVRIDPSGGIDENLIIYAKELRVNNVGGANAKIGRWQANDDYAMFGTDDMTGAEYSVLAGGATDGNTYISAQSGSNVIIRASANSTSNQATFSTTSFTVGSAAISTLVGSSLFYAGGGSSTDPIVHFTKTGNAPGNFPGFLAVNEYANHSWGIVGEFRITGVSGTDKPAILFSSGQTTTTWSVGFNYNDATFGIRQDRGHRNGGWGTERFTIASNGTVNVPGQFTAGSIYTANAIDAGTIGASGRAYLYGGIQFANNDYLNYDDTNDIYTFITDGSTDMTLDDGFMTLPRNGIRAAGSISTNDGMIVFGNTSEAAVNTTYALHSSIQFETDTYWGGVNTSHTGFIITCGGMNGWNTAELSFRCGNNWASYNSSSAVRLKGDRAYFALGPENAIGPLYSDGAGRIGYFSSRREWKNVIGGIDKTAAYSRIMALSPIEYTWKPEYRPEEDDVELIDFNVQRGFIAEDVEAIDRVWAQYGWLYREGDGDGSKTGYPLTEELSRTDQTLDDAVVVSYNDKAIFADLVATVQYLAGRVEELERSM